MPMSAKKFHAFRRKVSAHVKAVVATLKPPKRPKRRRPLATVARDKATAARRKYRKMEVNLLQLISLDRDAAEWRGEGYQGKIPRLGFRSKDGTIYYVNKLGHLYWVWKARPRPGVPGHFDVAPYPSEEAASWPTLIKARREALRAAGGKTHSAPKFPHPKWLGTMMVGTHSMVKIRLSGGKIGERPWAEYLGPAMTPGSHWVRLDNAPKLYALKIGDEIVVSPQAGGVMGWDSRNPGPAARRGK